MAPQQREESEGDADGVDQQATNDVGLDAGVPLRFAALREVGAQPEGLVGELDAVEEAGIEERSSRGEEQVEARDELLWTWGVQWFLLRKAVYRRLPRIG